MYAFPVSSYTEGMVDCALYLSYRHRILFFPHLYKFHQSTPQYRKHALCRSYMGFLYLHGNY